jgi:CheY-like chemotaxis protein
MTCTDETNVLPPASDADALDTSRSPRILVVDRSAERRRRMVATVRRLGCRPLEATTPLEAIRVLERHSCVTAAAVAEDLTQTEGHELVRFLSEAYVNLRLALVTHDDDLDAADDDDAFVRVSDRDDFAGPMRRLLER